MAGVLKRVAINMSATIKEPELGEFLRGHQCHLNRETQSLFIYFILRSSFVEAKSVDGTFVNMQDVAKVSKYDGVHFDAAVQMDIANIVSEVTSFIFQKLTNVDDGYDSNMPANVQLNTSSDVRCTTMAEARVGKGDTCTIRFQLME